MPMIRTDFSLNYTQSGWLMSAFSITNGISQLPSGWLADRFGRRLMILVSVTGVAIAGILIGLSHSYIVLIVFLIVKNIYMRDEIKTLKRKIEDLFKITKNLS